MLAQQFEELPAPAPHVEHVAVVNPRSLIPDPRKDRQVLLDAPPDFRGRTAELILEADVLVAVEVVELRGWRLAGISAGSRDPGSGIRLGFGIWVLGFGIYCELLNLSPKSVCGLLHDAQRRPQFLLLRRKRGDGRVVAPFTREQRLEVALNLILRPLAPVHGAADPVDRPEARVMRLDADRHVAVEMIDHDGVELLLARQDAAEQTAHAGCEPRLQASACRRLVDDPVQAVEAFDLMSIGRWNRRRAIHLGL